MSIKKITIVFLIIALISTLYVTYISSNDSDAAETYTENGLTYTLYDRGGDDSNTAEITKVTRNSLNGDIIIPKYLEFNGSKYHVVAVNVTFPTYFNKVSTLEIEENPGLVLKSGLFKNTYLTSAKIGEGVELCENMFNGCSRLKTVILPDSLTMVPKGTFAGCTSLSSVNLGDNVSIIGDSAFSKCKVLSEIHLTDRIESIGTKAFLDCSKITELYLGNNVSYIGSQAFSGTQISSFNISAKLTNIDIGPGCFLDDLDAISVPKENPAFMVEDGILYNKDKTTILYYPRTLTTADGSFSTSANIGPYAFYKTLLKKITITDGAKTIGDYAFSQCPRLEEVVIADSVTEIGEYAFAAANMNGNVLKSVILPSSLSAISNNMFAYCTNLPTITIPKNVTVIGNAAFSVCYALQSVKILGEILSIGKSAFTQCSSLKEINLPDSVTSIGSGAFEGDSELVITVLPRNLTTINTEAFMNCSLLNISSLPGTVTHIGSKAFNNTGIEKITVGETNQISIGENTSAVRTSAVNPRTGFNVFGGPGLKSICLNNINIEYSLYSGTIVDLAISENLVDYTLGPQFTLWKWDENGIGINTDTKTAYLIKNNVTKFIIPESVDKLSGTAFQHSSIEEIAFEGDISRTITLQTGETGSSSCIFGYCSELRKAVLPNIVVVGDSLKFFNCNALQYLEIFGINSISLSVSSVFLVMHSCSKLVFNQSAQKYMQIQFPSNLTSVSNISTLYSMDGTQISSGSVQKIAGKTFVWKGDYSKEGRPNLIETNENQAIIELNYGDDKAYIAIDKGSVPDLSKYIHKNHTVSKWYSDPEKKTEYVPKEVTGSLTLYAELAAPQYFTVTKSGDYPFDLLYYGETVGSSIKVRSGDTLQINATNKDGYNIVFKINDATSSSWSFVCTCDSVLSITYTQRSVKLVFNTVGADNISSISGKCGDGYDKPADPSKVGYTFVGWSPELGDTLPLTSSSSVTYTAMWIPNVVRITFDSVGGTAVESLDRSYNTIYGDLPVPAREGYTFAGWYASEVGGDQVRYEAVVKSIETISLYARWVINQYSISYMVDGVPSGDIESYDYNTEVSLRGVVGRIGYTASWISNDVAISDGKFILPAKDVVIYASYKVNQYSVSFDTGGGSEIATLKQDYGTPLDISDVPIKTGYSFVRWNPSIPATVPAEDITVTAVWKVNQYTISFDTDGGSSIASIIQDYDSVVLVPFSPVKIGYTFVGWSPMIPVTVPAEDITVTAVWKVNQYTISFDTDGGSSIASITQDYGTVFSTEAPQKEGYVFLNWTPELPQTIPAEDLLVSAVWAVLPSTNSDGRVSVDLTGSNDLFVVSDDATIIVVEMADNTSVRVKDASSLAGKVVSSKINRTNNITDIEGTAYEFLLTSDGNEYHGKMVVTLPYSKEDGKQAVVYYWTGAETVKMNIIDQGKDYVTFETDHNSVYLVASEEFDHGSDLLKMIVGVAIVIAALIAVITAVVYSRNKA